MKHKKRWGQTHNNDDDDNDNDDIGAAGDLDINDKHAKENAILIHGGAKSTISIQCTV